MKIVYPEYEILDLDSLMTKVNGESAILKKIERVARVCYKSEASVKEHSAERMIKQLIKNGHEAMLEHYSFSVLFTTDRGVSHELVRHRIASFAQESSRFCNYSHDKFGNEISVIKPFYLANDYYAYSNWEKACQESERQYFEMLRLGCTPQEARAVLPNSLKTEIVVTANLREWRHILKLRAAGTTGKPHPQMKEIMVPLLAELKELIPVVFDDITVYTE